MNPLQVGERVKYSTVFLRNIAAYTGPLGGARGRITSLQPLGGLTLASVAWEGDAAELPPRVNVTNLSRANGLG